MTHSYQTGSHLLFPAPSALFSSPDRELTGAAELHRALRINPWCDGTGETNFYLFSGFIFRLPFPFLSFPPLPFPNCAVGLVVWVGLARSAESGLGGHGNIARGVPLHRRKGRRAFNTSILVYPFLFLFPADVALCGKLLPTADVQPFGYL